MDMAISQAQADMREGYCSGGGGIQGSQAIRGKLIAGLVLLLAAAAAQAQATAWFDLSLDEQGRVTAAVPASEIHPALVDPIRDWVMKKTFAAPTVDSRSVRSTTSVWVSYRLEENDAGYELQFMNHGGGLWLVHREAPAYPRNALLRGQEGWARVHGLVEPSGKVGEVKVLESSNGAFAMAAVTTVLKWRFHPPGTVDGKPIGSEFEQTIVFELE